MLRLHVFGPAFGLHDVSPFVIKAHTLLRMAGIEYEPVAQSLRGAPRGKLPWLLDEGEVIADSTSIRLHLERKYSADFSGGYAERELAIGWALEKMLEEHCYWLGVHARWADEANFAGVTSRIFDGIPAVLRGFIRHTVRKRMLAALHAQGTGRYDNAERAELARRDMAALAAILGDKPYVLGDTPCAVDATAYAFVCTALCPAFNSTLRAAAESHASLRAYVERMKARYFEEPAEVKQGN